MTLRFRALLAILIVPAMAACGSGSGGTSVAPDAFDADIAADTIAPADAVVPDDAQPRNDTAASCRFDAATASPAVVALNRTAPAPVFPFPSDRFTVAAPGTATGSRVRLAAGDNVLTDDALQFLMPAADMSALLARLDGFSSIAPILVPFSGPLDPSTASDDPARSLDPEAPVFLVRLAPDGTCDQRVGVTFSMNDGQGPDQDITVLVARPSRPLVPGARYALVVTRGLPDTHGNPIGPDDGFAAPADLDCLATTASPRCPSDIATVAMFSTSAVTRTLAETRDWLRGPDAPPLNLEVQEAVPPGSLQIWPDTVTGFPASSVLVQGAFDAPDLRDATGDMPRAAGDPVLATGKLRIPFLLLLPSDAVAGPWPVVVLAHGKHGSKERLAYLAQRFGEAGLALAAIDAVGHGALAGLGDFDTFAIPTLRGSYLQSQADLLVFFRVLQQLADLDVLPAGAVDGIPDIDVAGGLGFIGESMGGITGGVACAEEPGIRSTVLNVTGGGLASLLLSYLDGVFPPEQATTSLALEALVQVLLEPADPLAFAGDMQAQAAGRSVLLQAAVDDDTVFNPNTDALARALDLTQVCPCAREVPGLPQATAPVYVDGLHYFQPAAHGFLLKNDSNPDASDAARRQAAVFLRTSLTGLQGEIVVP